MNQKKQPYSQRISQPGQFKLKSQKIKRGKYNTGKKKKRFSAIKARKRGADKGKFRFFIPPSHEDFVGLLYNFLGKGIQFGSNIELSDETIRGRLNVHNPNFGGSDESLNFNIQILHFLSYFCLLIFNSSCVLQAYCLFFY